jgi:hypothetical protein
MKIRRLVLTPALAAGIVALAAPAAFAGGPPVVNQTDHAVNATQTFIDVDPCTGVPAQITLTFSGVMHVTLFADGTGHFTETSHGTFAFDRLNAAGNPDGVDATGTFTDWDGGNGLFDDQGNPIGKAEFAFTLNGRGTNLADGSTFRFHNNGHLVADPTGAVKLSFFKSHCL